MNFLKLFIIVFSLLINPSFTFASPIEKTAEKKYDDVVGKIKFFISDDNISIAESILLKVAVIVPDGFRANLPSLHEYGFSLRNNKPSQKFKVTNMSKIETIPVEKGYTSLMQTFILEPWLSGKYLILPLMVSFYKKNDKNDDQKNLLKMPSFNVMTNGIRINVNSLDKDHAQLSDLFGQSDYSQKNLTKRFRRKEDKSVQELKLEKEMGKEAETALKKKSFPWKIVYIFIASILLVSLILSVYRKKLAKKFFHDLKPAHEIAYEALTRLANKKLLDDGQIKEFYYEISYILREYIGNRFQIFAVNQTTEEFFMHLKISNPFDDKTKSILLTFSDQADTIKYSCYISDANSARKSCKIVQSFIDNTKIEDTIINFKESG